MHLSLINIGITNDLSFRQSRVIQIVNVVSIIFGLLLPIAAYFNFQQSERVNGFAILMISSCYFLNLFWNRMQWYLLSKVVVCYGITIIPFLNLLLNGRIPDGQFLSLMTIAIVFSIASIILFDHKDEKFFYYFSILFYLLWISFIDIVIIQLSDTEPKLDFISEYYTYYKIPPILGLLALSIMVTFFKNIIFKYEAENEEIKIRLKHQNQELEERVEERTIELSTTMERIINIAFLTSHELRGPLTTIIGLTRLLKELPDDAAVNELLPQLHAKSKEMDLAIRKMNDVLQETVKLDQR